MRSVPTDASTMVGADLAALDEPEVPEARRRIETGGRSLRVYAAHGVIVNGAFDVGLSALSLLRGFVLAALLTRADYGVWGVLVVSLGVLAQLKVVGISDKYVQQEEPDQEVAFQKAFTLELLVTAAAMIPIALALPVVAVIYGEWKLVPPGIVLLTVLVANALQSPLWIYYRRMDFVRQRTLSTIEPVVAFVVAIGLAIAGLGYWALAIGLVAGAWAAALATLIRCPYRIRWRYDRGALRVYASFSTPIFIATAAGVVLANGTMIATNAHLGLAGAGAVALAANITAFTTRVDDLVSTTLYPAICAVQNRLDMLLETFVKANRLALMWALPFGFGVALFANDLVHFLIGQKWQPAVTMLQITGVVAAIAHIGFNWEGYFRARSDTRPLAVAGVASAVTLLGVGIPLLYSDGLTGLAVGIAAGAGMHLLVRAVYLSRLFSGFGFLGHAFRAILPTVPAVAAVAACRALESGPRTGAEAMLELVLYLLVTVAFTVLLERRLLAEVIGYVRRGTLAAE